MKTLDTWYREYLHQQNRDPSYEYSRVDDSRAEQIQFMRSDFTNLFYTPEYTPEEFGELILVINTHKSKGLELPVYLIQWKSGFTFVLRYNFHDWRATVLDHRVEILQEQNPEPSRVHPYWSVPKLEFPVYLKVWDKISDTSMEGFPDKYKKGSYAEDPRAFTFGCENHHALYAIFWHLVESVKQFEKVNA